MKESKYERGCKISCIDIDNSKVDVRGCCNKLDVYDWLEKIDDPLEQSKFVEVRFKNTRKGIYENTLDTKLKVGDIVAVEAAYGHDIGIVSSVGKIACSQLKRMNKNVEILKIYRKAKPVDINKWREAIALEIPTMLRTRELVDMLNLTMKIGDVEFQGDKTKAMFYYIAVERVDFRELIKKMAEEFRIRIEMKQIGARQEAGRIGGIGPCGRELCCTTWIKEFISVSTNSARIQEVSPNPQKLAGQCSKLKCCLNYELPVYLDARKYFPEGNTNLKLQQGTAYHIKNDIFKNLMYYEIVINKAHVIRSLHVDKVKEVLELNKNNIFPDDVFEEEKVISGRTNISHEKDLNSDSITRFDKKNNTNKTKRNNSNSNNTNNRRNKNKPKTNGNKT